MVIISYAILEHRTEVNKLQFMNICSVPRKTWLSDLVSTRLQVSISQCVKNVIRRQISINTASYNNIYHNTYLIIKTKNVIVYYYVRMDHHI
jgi:hypothetical protein